MSRVAVIGEALRTEGYALAGAVMLAAEDAAQARARWTALPADVAVVLLTARAAAWLAGETGSRPGVLLAVLPEPGSATGPATAARPGPREVGTAE